MESNTNLKKVKFRVVADDRDALKRAINYVNLQSNSDYVLIGFESHEVGLGTIEVSEGKMIPEFLFMMGWRYEIYRKKMKLNF